MSTDTLERTFTLQPLKTVPPVVVPASTTQLVAKRVNMTNEEYHADRSAVSSTSLKNILRSPLHYMHALTAPRTEHDHFRVGTAIHAYLLENARFMAEYKVTPDKGKTKVSKAAYQDFINANPGSRFVSQDEMDMILGIAEQVAKHSSATQLLSIGEAEQTFYWTDEETGILCKIRPDHLCAPFCILDVKSTVNASQEAFVRDIAKYHYDLSAAMYQEGIYRVTGERLDFAWLAVEKDAPHGVKLYSAEDYMETGYRKFRRSLKMLESCRATGLYPNYQADGQFEKIVRPGWHK